MWFALLLIIHKISSLFFRVLVQTILKLVGDSLDHAQHYLGTSKGRYNLNSKRENKPRPIE